nr:ATP-binding cassette domain-containing protein [uncultured Acetatifactor sp.]
MVWLFANAMGIRYYTDFLNLETRKDLGTVEHLSYYDIAFENVSFRYPGTERDILKNVTFYAKEGERIAFVGENGAGKSTIIKLLCGLYEPTTGNVTIGGVPVREISPGLRTRLLSVVFQNFQSYQMTLRENVAFGNPEALWDDEKLLHALELADAGELAESHGKGADTKGMDTKGSDTKGMDARGLDRNLGRLEKDGQDLSRGQWQRVAMARAFVSDAKYVILDEPTASLDPLAESRMYENFSRIFRERGTVLISHRLASARMADRILVLDGGRIVQTGSHEELMAREGLYRTMFLAQSSFYQDRGPEEEAG